MRKTALNFSFVLLALLSMVGKSLALANNVVSVDSLTVVLSKSSLPCEKLDLFIKLAEHYAIVNGDSAIHYSNLAGKYGGKCPDPKKKANAYFVLSSSLDLIGNYPAAIEKSLAALKIYESVSDKKSEALVLFRLGKITFHQSESSHEQLKEGYYMDALNYYRKALAIEKANNNLLGITNNNIEIGRTLFETGNNDSAIALLQIALEVSEKNKSEMPFLHNIAKSSYNMSLIYIKQKDYPTAIKFLAKAIEVDSLLNNKEGLAGIRMAEMYLRMGNATNAYLLAKSNLDTALKYGYDLRVMQATDVIYKALAAKGEYKEAYNFALRNRELTDELSNEKHIQEITRMEMSYNFTKQEEEKKIKHEAEKKQQRIIIYGVGTALVLVLLFLIYGVYTFRQKQKAAKIIVEQKREVEMQKMIVEEKNREVHDSIVYARRIQTAILPLDEVYNTNFSDAFVLYKPKDIVAGDFYFYERVGDIIIFAAADCTGHGVPGALVSVVCHNALKRSIREYGLIVPGEILNKTREIVIEEFDKSNGVVAVEPTTGDIIKDGMDIALCAYNVTTKQLGYAGANNPLWIVRNNELLEIKADKQPIGNYDVMKPFTTTTVEILENDSIYIFSDGFADQFGGEKSKKFKTSSMKLLLISIQSKTMKEQKFELDQVFENWKGNIEQVDDVCIIGIRI